jgi:hypothetical protein
MQNDKLPALPPRVTMTVPADQITALIMKIAKLEREIREAHIHIGDYLSKIEALDLVRDPYAQEWYQRNAERENGK